MAAEIQGNGYREPRKGGRQDGRRVFERGVLRRLAGQWIQSGDGRRRGRSEQLPVEGGLLEEGERVGPRGGGHPPESERAEGGSGMVAAGYVRRVGTGGIGQCGPGIIGAGGICLSRAAAGADVDASADGRGGAAELRRDLLRGLLAGGYQVVTVRNLPQQRRDVGRGNHLQEGVGGIVAEAAYRAGGVIEGEAFLRAEGADRGLVETLFAADAEMVLVAEVDEAHDAPEIIDPVRVEERHAPPFLLWRETPEEQDPCALRQERFERMRLDGHDFALEREGHSTSNHCLRSSWKTSNSKKTPGPYFL